MGTCTETAKDTETPRYTWRSQSADWTSVLCWLRSKNDQSPFQRRYGEQSLSLWFLRLLHLHAGTSKAHSCLQRSLYSDKSGQRACFGNHPNSQHLCQRQSGWVYEKGAFCFSNQTGGSRKGYQTQVEQRP